MSEPLVSIIVANFNGEAYLNTCLNSILSSSYEKFELLIIDDASQDKSLEIIQKFRKKDKRIAILKNSQNLGAAASRNKAIKISRGEIIVFLDNDTQVERNFLKELIKPLILSQRVGGVQALILDFHKRDLIQMAGGLLMPQTGWLIPFFQWKKKSQVGGELKERDIVAISAALAIKKDVLRGVTGFDEKEAIYTEDLDFCWRIWISGYSIVLAPKSVVYHFTKSVRQRQNMGASYQKIYFNLAKNSFRSILKNYEFKNVLRYLPMSLVINLGRGLTFFITKGKADALLGTLSAIIWTIYNLASTLSDRQIVQKKRVLSDSFLKRKIFIEKPLFEILRKTFL